MFAQLESQILAYFKDKPKQPLSNTASTEELLEKLSTIKSKIKPSESYGDQIYKLSQSLEEIEDCEPSSDLDYCEGTLAGTYSACWIMLNNMQQAVKALRTGAELKKVSKAGLACLYHTFATIAISAKEGQQEGIATSLVYFRMAGMIYEELEHKARFTLSVFGVCLAFSLLKDKEFAEWGEGLVELIQALKKQFDQLAHPQAGQECSKLADFVQRRIASDQDDVDQAELNSLISCGQTVLLDLSVCKQPSE
eukprot:CAMPEP_0168351648 /NCGR_PEP_ID=MMETSP0213-20121227/22010_1 /TAXON_ID=151035 /ORGANISM="Euplotes harpa, Strain FSP1.4" /LENGTH=251 /DNA_ID=CAMNT_0008362567 /DNA_START=2818 /DNA_END=3573 /DNA_ORIENTATION=-